MVVYGYAKEYMYSGDGTLKIKVRIPSIHGPYKQSDYRGNVVRNYVPDSDLPFYPALLMPYLPNDGEVVALMSADTSSRQFIVIGLTGGSYQLGATNIGG